MTDHPKDRYTLHNYQSGKDETLSNAQLQDLGDAEVERYMDPQNAETNRIYWVYRSAYNKPPAEALMGALSDIEYALEDEDDEDDEEPA